MNANELRIGNLVYYRIDDEMDERQSWNQVNTIDVQDLEFIERNDTNYTPIPLTEEWLLKFGFKKRTSTSWTLNEVDIWLVDGIFENFIDNPVQYVHQLQNLYFALTQTELTYTP
jgi:hypothetical protein